MSFTMPNHQVTVAHHCNMTCNASSSIFVFSSGGQPQEQAPGAADVWARERGSARVCSRRRQRPPPHMTDARPREGEAGAGLLVLFSQWDVFSAGVAGSLRNALGWFV